MEAILNFLCQLVCWTLAGALALMVGALAVYLTWLEAKKS